MKPQEAYRDLKKEAYRSIVEKRASSKGWNLMLELAPFFLGRRRGNLLLVVNTGMRTLDNITDGDRPAPTGTTPLAYLDAKRAFIRNPDQEPQDDLDRLFQHSFKLAAEEGLSIGPEMDAFFEYFIFDAKRHGSGKIFSRAELDKAYDACDITATIRLSLMVFGDDPEKAELGIPLGKSTRSYYTLRDYEEDIAAGFVNIPQEAIDKYGITRDDLQDRFSPSVRKWFHEEAELGLKRIDEHNAMMKKNKIKILERLFLPVGYVRPASKYFRDVLANKK